MRLEQFQRGRSLHLGRNHAQKIVLDAYYIDSDDFIFIDNELQRACELLHLISFPMESYADGDVIKQERRLGEHRRHRDGIEQEFVVERSVIRYAAVFVNHFLFSCAV